MIVFYSPTVKGMRGILRSSTRSIPVLTMTSPDSGMSSEDDMGRPA